MIVEKSDIIRQGLSKVLTHKNNSHFVVEQCKGEIELLHSVHKSAPKILIASPSFLEENQKQIEALNEKYQMLLVGLVYSFQNPDSLTNYDEVIYINDKAEKIQSTINDLLKTNNTNGETIPSESLTSREKEILKLLVNGNTTKEIATTLNISTHTVNAHRKNIMRKLDIKTVSGLTIYAVLNNIISLKEA